jgi:hypothetical protein
MSVLFKLKFTYPTLISMTGRLFGCQSTKRKVGLGHIAMQYSERRDNRSSRDIYRNYFRHGNFHSLPCY